MKKTYKINPKNSKLTNFIMLLLLSPVLLLGGITLVLGILLFIVGIVSSIPLMAIFYSLGLIIDSYESEDGDE